MIVRSATAATFPLMFSSGHPDGNVTWILYDATGSVTSSGVITPAADAVSIVIPVPASANTLGSGVLFSYRDLAWSYTLGGAVVNGELRYSIEARLPIGASNDGVRRKLGVDSTDLPDSDISLIKAYLGFQSSAGTAAMAAALTGGAADLVIIDAIEATAALDLIPTMAVRVAASEESGTDKFKRQEVDWNMVALGLSTMVTNALVAINPTYDPTTDYGALLVLATPSVDAITGATAT